MLNMVKSLNENYEFFVFTKDHEFRNYQEKLEVVSDSWVKLLSNTKVYYCSSQKVQYSFLKTLIQNINPDFVYLNGLYEIDFIIYPIIISQKLKIKIIQAPRGMLQQGALNLKPLKKKIYLSVFKFFHFHNSIRWHATDKQEYEDVKKTFGNNALVVIAEVIPNIENTIFNTKSKTADSLSLITISLIAEKKNHLFVLELLSKINFSVTYHICGPIKDDNYWEKCKKAINELPENIEVKYHGPINPLKVNQYFSLAHFFILPTMGENFGHSIFEALNNCVPVILSDKTPWKDLNRYKSGWDIPLENKNLFLDVLSTCFKMSGEEYLEMCNCSKDLAKQFINNASFSEKYFDLFD